MGCDLQWVHPSFHLPPLRAQNSPISNRGFSWPWSTWECGDKGLVWLRWVAAFRPDDTTSVLCCQNGENVARTQSPPWQSTDPGSEEPHSAPQKWDQLITLGIVSLLSVTTVGMLPRHGHQRARELIHKWLTTLLSTGAQGWALEPRWEMGVRSGVIMT